MIGHCGGLRPSQRIGDYVLAHAYLRDDHVLDDMLPPEIPIPPIAEVQQALARAAETVSGEDPETLKRRLRTSTIVTTDETPERLAEVVEETEARCPVYNLLNDAGVNLEVQWVRRVSS